MRRLLVIPTGEAAHTLDELAARGDRLLEQERIEESPERAFPELASMAPGADVAAWSADVRRFLRRAFRDPAVGAGLEESLEREDLETALDQLRSLRRELA